MSYSLQKLTFDLTNCFDLTNGFVGPNEITKGSTVYIYMCIQVCMYKDKDQKKGEKYFDRLIILQPYCLQKSAFTFTLKVRGEGDFDTWDTEKRNKASR